MYPNWYLVTATVLAYLVVCWWKGQFDRGNTVAVSITCKILGGLAFYWMCEMLKAGLGQR